MTSYERHVTCALWRFKSPVTQQFLQKFVQIYKSSRVFSWHLIFSKRETKCLTTWYSFRYNLEGGSASPMRSHGLILNPHYTEDPSPCIHHQRHYSDVIMGAMASQISSLTIVYSTVDSGTAQRKHQSSASLAFVRGIHRWPVNSPHKGPVTRKMFPFDDVIMEYTTSWNSFCEFADITSQWRHLGIMASEMKSLEMRLFVRQLFGLTTKSTSLVLCVEITGDSLQKEPVMRKGHRSHGIPWKFEKGPEGILSSC